MVWNRYANRNTVFVAANGLSVSLDISTSMNPYIHAVQIPAKSASSTFFIILQFLVELVHTLHEVVDS